MNNSRADENSNIENDNDGTVSAQINEDSEHVSSVELIFFIEHSGLWGSDSLIRASKWSRMRR